MYEAAIDQRVCNFDRGSFICDYPWHQSLVILLHVSQSDHAFIDLQFSALHQDATVHQGVNRENVDKFIKGVQLPIALILLGDYIMQNVAYAKVILA